jgi:hypothetical protein
MIVLAYHIPNICIASMKISSCRATDFADQQSITVPHVFSRSQIVYHYPVPIPSGTSFPIREWLFATYQYRRTASYSHRIKAISITNIRVKALLESQINLNFECSPRVSRMFSDRSTMIYMVVSWTIAIRKISRRLSTLLIHADRATKRHSDSIAIKFVTLIVSFLQRYWEMLLVSFLFLVLDPCAALDYQNSRK